MAGSPPTRSGAAAVWVGRPRPREAGGQVAMAGSPPTRGGAAAVWVGRPRPSRDGRVTAHQKRGPQDPGAPLGPPGRTPDGGPWDGSCGVATGQGAAPSEAVAGPPATGTKDRAGRPARRPPDGGRPAPVPHPEGPPPPPKEIPLPEALRRAGLEGRSRGGLTGRAAREGDAAAKVPPSAAGANVGCGSLADGQRLREILGGKPRSAAASGRGWPRAPSSLAPHTAGRGSLAAPASLLWKAALGTQWGQTDARGNRGPSQDVGPRPSRSGAPNRRPLHLTVLAHGPRDPWGGPGRPTENG
ncbi:hypothetical protein FKW77_006713 [Venturia effusa]|uniref:Uncharacterized protein n=1 Tax=Venturia effusa TaxID=50376 RepID=A0A517L9H7_9PEZI|nr:hypothetical protein FKW77_006713 [Venturia effusa]